MSSSFLHSQACRHLLDSNGLYFLVLVCFIINVRQKSLNLSVYGAGKTK